MKTSKRLQDALRRWNDGDVELLDLMKGSRSPDRKRKPKAQPLEEVERKELKIVEKLYPVLAATMGIAIISVLLLTVAYLPERGAVDVPANNEVAERYVEQGMEETGAVNLVAGMILDYRAFDTLGESHVLFTGLCAVFIMLQTSSKKRELEQRREDRVFDLTGDAILRQVVRLVFPMILMFGIYVMLNGHLSPGGGFSGGAILGGGLILYSLAYGFDRMEKIINQKTFSIVALAALAFYSLSKCYSFFTGANGLESIISEGTAGNILSAGLILPLNIAVGLVVACTIYGIYSVFQRGRI